MILWRGCEWFSFNELKRRPPETGTKIEGLRTQLLSVERQQAAFDMVIQTYEPEYSPAGAPLTTARRMCQGVVNIRSCRRLSIAVALSFACFAKPYARSRPAKRAQAFARETGLAENDIRVGQIANRFSQTLDQLAKADRVRRAGKADGYRYLWEAHAQASGFFHRPRPGRADVVPASRVSALVFV